jgi:hypothetical protein
MKKMPALLAVTGFFIAGQARADGFSYTYLDFALGSVHGTNSGNSKNGNAVRVTWEYELGPDLYFLLEGGGTSYDVYDPDLDQDVKLSPGILSVGFGFGSSLTPNLDFTAGLSWDTLNLEAQIYDEFRNIRYFHGAGVHLGLRGRIGKRVQWTAATHYTYVEHVHSIPSVSLGGRFFIFRGFAMGLEGFVRRYDRYPVELKESGAMVVFGYEWPDRY